MAASGLPRRKPGLSRTARLTSIVSLKPCGIHAASRPITLLRTRSSRPGPRSLRSSASRPRIRCSSTNSGIWTPSRRGTTASGLSVRTSNGLNVSWTAIHAGNPAHWDNSRSTPSSATLPSRRMSALQPRTKRSPRSCSSSGTSWAFPSTTSATSSGPKNPNACPSS